MERLELRRALGAILAAILLLSGCSDRNAEPAAVDSEPQDVQQENAQREDAQAVRTRADWAKNAVIYEVNVRQYTPEGTFAAFAEHLPELREMGINTLWFMPIHPISQTKRSGTLGSYYSVTDYRAVNPEFGTSDDFGLLVDAAHLMGFHVMLDWVANHTGWDCPWISEHPDWYTQDAAGNIISPEGMGWPDVADLNYDNADMREEMIACMKYWVEEFDIDGFRCDFANGVPTDFWEAARAELETVKPVLMLAEDNKVRALLDYAFDCNYNWDLYETLMGVAHDTKKANSIKYYIPENYPEGTWTLNFLDNHDKNSYEHTIMDAIGADALPAMFSLLYTIPGTPMIYTGDEIGLDHALAFMEKDPVDWESSGVSYRPLLAELAGIRDGNPALYSGEEGGAFSYIDRDNRNVFTFRRETEGNSIYFLSNLSRREQTADFSDLFSGQETVLLYGRGAGTLDMEDATIPAALYSGEITLQPWEFWIISGA